MGDRIGQYIDDYRLVRRLGSGAFGEVYLGEHAHDQSQVAVKVLQFTQENLKGFIKEASTAFRLRHPHIVQLLSFGISADDTPYLIMDYASNGTLRERHPKGTQLPLDIVLSYLLPLASALQYAHDRRVVHRDVKPENVLIGPVGEVLLSDFGIAVVAPIERSFSTQNLGGTAPYMAPEQIRGKPQPASDQYALGTMVYEWLCGVRPFQGNQWKVLEQQRSSPPPPLREKRPDLPLQVEEVILKALAKDPQDRFACVQDFAVALKPASRETLAQPMPALDSLTQPQSDRDPTVSQVVLPEAFPQTPSVAGPTLQSQNNGLASASAHVRPSSPASAAPDTFAPFASSSTSDPTGHAQSASLSKPPFPEYATPYPSSFMTDYPKDELRLPQRGISRRTVVLALAGLAGVGVASGALVWRMRLQSLPIVSPTTPISHPPTPISHPTTLTVGTTLYTYHNAGAYTLAWSPDGQSIASTSDGGTVQVWNANDGHIISTYQPSNSAVITSIAWSPNGKLIACNDFGDAVDIWDVTTGNHVFTYHGLFYGADSLAWSPDSKLIASGGGGNSNVEVWRASTGEHIDTYPGISGAGNLTSVKWSPDGKRIVSGYLGNVALVWDATTGGHVLIFSSHSQGISDVAWSPNGQYIASGGVDATAQVWDATTGDRIYTYTGHSQTVDGVAWSPNGKRIASASADGTVQVWDATTGNHVSIYRGHTGRFVSHALWSPDGGRIASVGDDDTVRVWVAQ